MSKQETRGEQASHDSRKVTGLRSCCRVSNKHQKGSQPGMLIGERHGDTHIPDAITPLEFIKYIGGKVEDGEGVCIMVEGEPQTKPGQVRKLFVPGHLVDAIEYLNSDECKHQFPTMVVLMVDNDSNWMNKSWPKWLKDILGFVMRPVEDMTTATCPLWYNLYPSIRQLIKDPLKYTTYADVVLKHPAIRKNMEGSTIDLFREEIEKAINAFVENSPLEDKSRLPNIVLWLMTRVMVDVRAAIEIRKTDRPWVFYGGENHVRRILSIISRWGYLIDAGVAQSHHPYLVVPLGLAVITRVKSNRRAIAPVTRGMKRKRISLMKESMRESIHSGKPRTHWTIVAMAALFRNLGNERWVRAIFVSAMCNALADVNDVNDKAVLNVVMLLPQDAFWRLVESIDEIRELMGGFWVFNNPLPRLIKITTGEDGGDPIFAKYLVDAICAQHGASNKLSNPTGYVMRTLTDYF
jgi:hypothetical protein